MRMLVRRGLRPENTAADVPFPLEMDEQLAERLTDRLGHYAFRLFLRGAIQKPEGFRPEETTRYISRTQAESHAEELVELGLADRMPHGRYKLKRAARSFGGTLEWYVARELQRRYGFDVVTGVRLHTRGIGGDLDVVAAAEGKLIHLELKSSPPRNLASNEITAFCDRLSFLQPDLSLFVVDTALRLSDKVLPMFIDEFARRGLAPPREQRVAEQLWALTPRIYLVNGSRDLMRNIGKAIAAGLKSLARGIFAD